MVYSPHENREYRVIGSEKFSFWVFHLGAQEKLNNIQDSDLQDITLNFLVFILAMELSIFTVFLRSSFVYSSPFSSPFFSHFPGVALQMFSSTIVSGGNVHKLCIIKLHYIY